MGKNGKSAPDIQKLLADTWMEIIPWQIDMTKETDEQAMKVMEKKGSRSIRRIPKAFLEGSKFIYDKYMKDARIAKFVNAGPSDEVVAIRSEERRVGDLLHLSLSYRRMWHNSSCPPFTRLTQGPGK